MHVRLLGCAEPKATFYFLLARFPSWVFFLFLPVVAGSALCSSVAAGITLLVGLVRLPVRPVFVGLVPPSCSVRRLFLAVF